MSAKSASTSAYVAFVAGATTAIVVPYFFQLISTASTSFSLSPSSCSASSSSNSLPSTFVSPYDGEMVNVTSAAADSAGAMVEYEKAVLTSRARIPRWTSLHLKDRYCGLLYELNDAGFAVIWAFKLVIETRIEDAAQPSVVAVTGYLRWRIVNVEPSVPLGTWMRYEEKIEHKWEADEVFAGKLDLTLGMLQTASHTLRAIDGNPAYPASHIAAGAYTFVLMQDGNELTGSYTIKPDHYSQAAASASISRCYAY